MVGVTGLISGLGLGVAALVVIIALVLVYRSRYHLISHPLLRVWFVLFGSMVPVGSVTALLGHSWGVMLIIAGIPIYFSGFSMIVSDRIDRRGPVIASLSKPTKDIGHYVSRLARHLGVWSLLVGSIILAFWMIHIMSNISEGFFSTPVFIYALASVTIGCFAPLAGCYIHDDIRGSAVSH